LGRSNGYLGIKGCNIRGIKGGNTCTELKYHRIKNTINSRIWMTIPCPKERVARHASSEVIRRMLTRFLRDLTKVEHVSNVQGQSIVTSTPLGLLHLDVGRMM
jgi:hypothetical protein